MRAAIIQSCYVPWKGYFDVIRSVDHFILLDDVQYSRGNFRNRNRIKSAKGPRWLTIPLRLSGTFGARIDEMRIADPRWNEGHRSTLLQCYRDCPGWPVLRDWMRDALLMADAPTLSEVNDRLLRSLCELLGIGTTITQSSEHGVKSDDPTERVVRLCRAVGATHYVSGPSARSYMRDEPFAAAGITYEYFEYGGYVEYAQPHGPFLHEVSILDAMACLGDDARKALDRVSSPRSVADGR